MRPSTTWIACVALGSLTAIGCTFDQGGVSSANDGGSGAGQPDAAAVSCQSNTDCATPPDLCHQSGTCTPNGTCAYPAVDCSSLDGACSAGTCDPGTGACVAAATNEGAVCAPALIGEWSTCETDATCGLSGQRKRLVSEQTCVAGACVPGNAVEETEGCNLPPQDVEGTPCGAYTCGDWGPCEKPQWGDQCSSQGEQRRSCSGSACTFLGTCDNQTWEETQSCAVDTNGDDCWGCWGPGGPSQDCECDGGQCLPKN
jgi:hypothetical protein